MNVALTIAAFLIALVLIGLLLFVFTPVGEIVRDKIDERRSRGLTNLQDADALSTAQELDARLPGAARDPHSIVLGYYVDAKNAARVRRDPEGSGQLVSTVPHRASLVVGPPGSSKTSTILAGACLTFGKGRDPIMVASVKHDLAAATIKLRSKLGPVHIFDPAGQCPSELHQYISFWTPLQGARTWESASAIASSMVFAGRETSGDTSFWDDQSASLLSVLLFVTASQPGTSMQDVSNLLIELQQPPSKDDDIGDPVGFDRIAFNINAQISRYEARLKQVRKKAEEGELPTAEATEQISTLEQRLDEFAAAQETLGPFATTSKSAPQTTAGVVSSLSNVLSVYRFSRKYAAVKWDQPGLIDIDEFIKAESSAQTLYLVAPPTDQVLYAPILAAFAQRVIARAYQLASISPGGSLRHPLLVVLDELHSIPIKDLPQIAATSRSYKISLLLATQDFSQLKEKFGVYQTNSLVSCCESLVVLPRTKDPETLQLVSSVAGEVKVRNVSKTVGTSTSRGEGDKAKGESFSETESWDYRPLLPSGRIAAFADLEAFCITGSYRCQLLLRPFYKTPVLTRLANGDVHAIHDENSQVATSIPLRPEQRLADFSETTNPTDELAPKARRAGGAHRASR